MLLRPYFEFPGNLRNAIAANYRRKSCIIPGCNDRQVAFRSTIDDPRRIASRVNDREAHGKSGQRAYRKPILTRGRRFQLRGYILNDKSICPLLLNIEVSKQVWNVTLNSKCPYN